MFRPEMVDVSAYYPASNLSYCVPIGHYSFGWAVRYGALEGIGSYRTKAQLIAAIHAEMRRITEE